MSTLPATDKIYVSEDFITWSFQQANIASMEGPIQSTEVLDFVNKPNTKVEFNWLESESFFGAVCLKPNGKLIINFLHFPISISKNAKCKFRIALDIGSKITAGWFSKTGLGRESNDLKTFEIRRNDFYEISELKVETKISSGFIDLEITQNKNEIIISINGQEKMISAFNIDDTSISFGLKCLTGKAVIDSIEFGTVNGENSIFKGLNFTSTMNGAKFVIPDSIQEHGMSKYFEINDADILSVPVSISDDFVSTQTVNNVTSTFNNTVDNLSLIILGNSNNRKKFKIWFSDTPSTVQSGTLFESVQMTDSNNPDVVHEYVEAYYERRNNEKTVFVNVQFQQDLTNPEPPLKVKFDNFSFTWSSSVIPT